MNEIKIIEDNTRKIISDGKDLIKINKEFGELLENIYYIV